MLDPNNILIGGTGRLYVAPEGTVMPAYLTDELDPLFVDLGYITDDGAKFMDGKTTNDVRPWQSFYPVRTHITERTGSLEFSLLEWKAETMIFAFGGGGFTEPQPGQFRYHPPSPEDLAINAVVLDVTDGDKNYRWGIARTFVTSNTESTLAKTGPALLPITLTFLANGEEDPWTFDSDADAFTPPAS